MKMMLYFGAAYILFFAVPFPCIMYYSIGYPVADDMRVGTGWALALLVLSLLLWSAVAAAYVRTLLWSPFRAYARVRAVEQAAIHRRARIVRAQPTGRRIQGWQEWKLRLAFENLSGAAIQDELLIVDTKPELHRFVAGNTLDIRLSPEPGSYPNVVIDGSRSQIAHGSLLVRGLIGIVLGMVLLGYYAWSWLDQSQGQGWTFLSPWHPLITMPASLCFYLLVGRLITGLITRLIGIDRATEALNYLGIATQARVLGVRQTGSQINNQPELEFDLAFEDQHGRAQTASVRKVVSLLDLATVPREQVRILYHPNDPTQVLMPDL